MTLRRMSAARSRKPRKTRRPLDLEMMERRQLLTIFTVINNGDSGTGSLRQAIINANSSPGGDTIRFNLPNTELTIAPATALPALSDSGTVIDGTTQPNYDATTGRPLVVLTGTGLPANTNADGLDVTGGACTIKGLTINNFGGGITLETSPGDLVQDCYIGTSANGMAAAPNGGGIGITTSSCTIGGTTVAQRNVISGNQGSGIEVLNGNKATIQGNYIGVAADGTTPLGNSDEGIDLEFSVGNQIGGVAAGAGNVISGNSNDGVFIFVGGSTGDTIQGNFIGTDKTGTVGVPNGDAGVFINSAANMLIGGPNAAGNIISANGAYGIFLLGIDTKNISIEGNKIGVPASGSGALPNKLAGIWVNGGNNSVIGGAAVTLGNEIANNGTGTTPGGPGIEVQSGTSIEILSNSIHDNTNGGIFLSPGANDDLPAPILTLAQTAAGQTQVAGALTVDPTTGAGDNFVIQFFANPTADPAGKFEGQTLLGQILVTADADGNAPFDVRLPTGTTVGFNITATATQEVVQDTSAFSTPIPVTPAPTTDLKVSVVPAPSPDLFGTNETYTVTIQNAGANDDTNVVYTGTIDLNSTFVSATSSQGPAPTFASNIITADLGTIAAGQSATVTIVVSPNSVGTISLTSSATGDIIDTNPGNNNVTTTVTINPSADVDVTINSNPSPVAAGQLLTYVVTVVNNGPSVASNVTVDDLLPDGLTDLTVDPGDGTVTGETATEITIDLGDIPVGGSETITITGNAPDTAGPIVDQATANSDTVADPLPDNNTAQNTTLVENAVNLGLVVAAAPNPATVNRPLTYTIAVTNATDQFTGLVPSPATAAVLTDVLPAGIDPNSIVVTTTQGTFTVANGVVTVNLGTIAPDQSPPIVTISVVPLTSGTYVNKATISDDVEINTNTTNTTVTTTVLASPSDIAVTIATSPTTAAVGAPLTYVVTVKNNGPAAAPGVFASNMLPSGVTLKSVSTSQGTFAVSGQKINVTIGTIASGKSVTITIVVVPPASGQIVDIAGASSNDIDPTPGNNFFTATTLVSPADIEIAGTSSTATPFVGDPFVYGFTIYNFGPAAAANTVVNFPLPAGDAFVGATPSQGAIAAANGLVRASFGTVAAGQFATVFVTVIPTVSGAQKATATVASSNFDPNSSNNTASVAATASTAPGTFVLASTNFSGKENAGSIPITIDRINGTQGAIDVSFFTVNGSATAGTNFTATTGTVHFAAGQTVATVNVKVKDDGAITGNLVFFFGINGATNGGKLGTTTAATVTEINVDRDLTPPEVVSVVPIEGGAGVAGYAVDFSKPLDPTSASNANNYLLFTSGRDSGTANTIIRVAAVYDAAADSVILVPSQPLALNTFYGLMVTQGVMDASGNALDGDGDGVAGGNYGSYVGIGNSLTYRDSATNLVNLSAAGAQLLMVRNFSGDPFEVEVLGNTTGHAVLAGAVRRIGASSGVTSIGEIDGLGPFGSVNANMLTSPPFFVGLNNFTPSLPVPQSIAAAETIGEQIPNGPRYVLTRLKAVLG